MHIIAKALCTASACALLSTASPASAATVLFTGMRFQIDAPGPQSPRCGARTTINVRNSPNSVAIGTSNLGSFLVTMSHCFQFPPPGSFDLGEFSYDFGSGDLLVGTYDGELTAKSPGMFDILQEFIVTGGTGRFQGATGSFISLGVLDLRGPKPVARLTFEGLINAPAIAVPEPATWAMMIGGFAIAGLAARRGRSAASRILVLEG